MIFDNYFLVIPVYRLSEVKYYCEMNNDFESLVSSSWEESFRERNPDLVRNWQHHHRSTYGGDWEFNEVTGYIKLYFMGTQVRGEYWSTIPKRKVRTRKKQFEYKNHKLYSEVEIRAQTNEGVLAAVQEYVAGCKKLLKGRHVDLREFEALKDHLNWKSLFETKNIFA